jgi:arsenite-transporting ATPase
MGEIAEEGLAELQDSFRDIPMFTLMLQKHELKSLPVLEAVSAFYGNQDPVKVLANQKIFSISPAGDNYKMDIYLGFAEKVKWNWANQG